MVWGVLLLRFDGFYGVLRFVVLFWGGFGRVVWLMFCVIGWWDLLNWVDGCVIVGFVWVRVWVGFGLLGGFEFVVVLWLGWWL